MQINRVGCVRVVSITVAERCDEGTHVTPMVQSVLVGEPRHPFAQC